jgi:hypothetical protein
VNRVFPTTRFYELNVKLLDELETIPDDDDGDAKVSGYWETIHCSLLY